MNWAGVVTLSVKGYRHCVKPFTQSVTLGAQVTVFAVTFMQSGHKLGYNAAK